MIVSNEVLTELIAQLKNQGKTIVFTNGCFDIIHSGHIIYLNAAKKLGDYLILGLNSDDSVKRLKGKSRPVNSEFDRAIVLDSLKPIDFVTVFEEDTPFKLISKLKPDVLVKGGDYSIENIVGADIVQENGGKVVTIPFVDGKSTTLIISKLNESKNE